MEQQHSTANWTDEETGRLIVAERQRTDTRAFKRKLTTRQERELAHAYSDGELKVYEIAEQFGVSHTMVRNISLNHEVPQRLPALSAAKTQLDKDKAARLREAGFTNKEIAETLDASVNCVANFFSRTPHTKLTWEEMVRRRALRAQQSEAR
jgi:DNA-binding NarL/FixJ family response regulator